MQAKNWYTFMQMQIIAARIKALRDDKKWTQEQLGKRAGVSQKTISNIERAGGLHDTVELSNIEKIAHALGVDTYALMIPDENTYKLITNYQKAGAVGKETILRISEMEAKQVA